jgi:2-polyprenylphenol 6-hydroxylase
MNPNAGVTILGGGPIGLAAGLSLLDVAGLGAVRVVESGSLAMPAAASNDFDVRVYALSPATRRLLESIGVWSLMRAARVTPVTAMEIHGDQPQGLLDLSAREPLAWIVEHRELMGALATRARERGLDVVEHATAERWIAPAGDGEASQLVLADRTLEQALIIGADGANSWLRAQAGLAAQLRDYESLGVVANFRCSRPHLGFARQWFRGTDVLAGLPLPGDHLSIVWSTSRSEGERLQKLEPAEFAAEVALAGGAEPGELELISSVAAFPLRRILAPVSVAQGLALIGDAAHAIHPLAGQGANLGFGDVVALCDVLRGRSALQSAGSRVLLRRMERARREDVLAMALLTDRLKALFELQSDGVARLRNEGMAWVNRRNAVKHAMMRAAMG